MSIYYFTAKVRKKPVASCIVTGAADKAQARRAAVQALPYAITGAGSLCKDITTARRYEKLDASLGCECRMQVNLGLQRDLAALVGLRPPGE